MSSDPTQRMSVVTDLYRLLLDGLLFSISGCFVQLLVCLYVDIEVLLNHNNTLLHALISEGVQKILGDMIVSDSDPLLLVCKLCFFVLVDCFSFDSIQRVTFLLSSSLVDYVRLEGDDREDVSLDVIGNIMKLIMV